MLLLIRNGEHYKKGTAISYKQEGVRESFQKVTFKLEPDMCDTGEMKVKWMDGLTQEMEDVNHRLCRGTAGFRMRCMKRNNGK